MKERKRKQIDARKLLAVFLAFAVLFGSLNLITFATDDADSDEMTVDVSYPVSDGNTGTYDSNTYADDGGVDIGDGDFNIGDADFDADNNNLGDNDSELDTCYGYDYFEGNNNYTDNECFETLEQEYEKTLYQRSIQPVALDSSNLSPWLTGMGISFDVTEIYSGKPINFDLLVWYSTPDEPFPENVEIRIPLPGFTARNFPSGIGAGSALYWCTASETLIVNVSTMHDSGGGDGTSFKSYSFSFLPFLNLSTPNEKVLDVVARLYVDGVRATGVTPEFSSASIRAIADIENSWSEVASMASAVNQGAATIANNVTTLAGNLVFHYNPRRSETRVSRLEATSRLSYTDRIEIPTGMIVTRNMISYNTTGSGGGFNTNLVETTLILKDRNGNIITDDSTPVAIIDVEFVVVNSGVTAATGVTQDLPNNINSTLTISGAQVLTDFESFTISSSGVRLKAVGITDGAPDNPSYWVSDPLVARNGITINRESVFGGTTSIPQPRPVLTKTASMHDLTAVDSPLADWIPTQTTFSLSGFGNALLSDGSNDDFDAKAREFTIIDRFYQYGDLLHLHAINLGEFENAYGVYMDIFISFGGDSVGGSWSSMTSIPLWDLPNPPTVDLGGAQGQQVNEIRFEFNMGPGPANNFVPEGFRIASGYSIDLVFNTSTMSTPPMAHANIINHAALSYWGAEFQNGETLSGEVPSQGVNFTARGSASVAYYERTDPLVDIHKAVRNISTGLNYDHPNVEFMPGDEVEFTLTFRNADLFPLTNIRIKDFASPFLDFSAFITNGYFEFEAFRRNANQTTGGVNVTSSFTVTGPEAADWFNTPVSGNFQRTIWEGTPWTSPSDLGFVLGAGQTLVITYRAHIHEDATNADDLSNYAFMTGVYWLPPGNRPPIAGGGTSSSPGSINPRPPENLNVLRAGIHQFIYAVHDGNNRLGWFYDSSINQLRENYGVYGANLGDVQVDDGYIVTFRLRVANLNTVSTVDLVNPAVVAYLPRGMEFIPNSARAGIPCSSVQNLGTMSGASYEYFPETEPSQSRIVWHVDGSLQTGQEWVFEFRARVMYSEFTNHDLVLPSGIRVDSRLAPFPTTSGAINVSPGFTFDLSNNNFWGIDPRRNYDLSFADTFIDDAFNGTQIISQRETLRLIHNLRVEMELRAFRENPNIPDTPYGDGWVMQTNTHAGANNNRLRSGDNVFYRATLRTTGTTPVTVTHFVIENPSHETIADLNSIRVYNDGEYIPITARTVLEPSGNILVNFQNQLVSHDQDFDFEVHWRTTVNEDAAEATVNTTPNRFRGTNSGAFYLYPIVPSFGILTGVPNQAANAVAWRDREPDTGVSNWDMNPDTRTRYRVSAAVFYNAGTVVPFISKAPHFIDQNFAWSPLTSAHRLQDGNLFGWSVRVENQSLATTPMVNPTIIDILPNGVTFMPDTVRLGIGSGGTPLPNPTIEYLGQGRNMLIWNFEDLHPSANVYSLTPGAAPFTFSFETQVASHFIGTVTNAAYLIPREPFYFVGNVSGVVGPQIITNITHNDENKPGVRNDATAMITGFAGIRPSKNISGTLNGSPQTTIGNSNNRITVDRQSEFRYSLTVHNEGTRIADNLVIIDVLPHLGDTGVAMHDFMRGSQFYVNLTGPVSVVSPSAIALYTIEYTTRDFGANPIGSADWDGGGLGWMTDPIAQGLSWADITAFRVAFDGQFLPNAEVEVMFDAVASDSAALSQIAWNSIAIEFVIGQLNIRPRLEPQPVGVSVSDNNDGELIIEKSIESTVTFGERIFVFDVFGYDAWGNRVWDSRTNGGYPNGLLVNVSSNNSGQTTLTDLPQLNFQVVERTVAGFTPFYYDEHGVRQTNPAMARRVVFNGTSVDDGTAVLFEVVNVHTSGGGIPDNGGGSDITTPPITTPPAITVPQTPTMPEIPIDPYNPPSDYLTIYDEYGAPIGRWVWDEEQNTWIFEDLPPLLGLPRIPQTGLGNNVLNWLFLMISLITMAVLLRSRKTQTFHSLNI